MGDFIFIYLFELLFNYLYKVRNVRTLSLLAISLLHHSQSQSQFSIRFLTITVRERILIELFSFLLSNFIQKWKSNTIFLFFFYKRPCDLLSKIQLNIRRHRFPSRKFEGANQNAAWTIHENEKYLSNWPNFSKPRLD